MYIPKRTSTHKSPPTHQRTNRRLPPTPINTQIAAYRTRYQVSGRLTTALDTYRLPHPHPLRDTSHPIRSIPGISDTALDTYRPHPIPGIGPAPHSRRRSSRSTARCRFSLTHRCATQYNSPHTARSEQRSRAQPAQLSSTATLSGSSDTDLIGRPRSGYTWWIS